LLLATGGLAKLLTGAGKGAKHVDDFGDAGALPVGAACSFSATTPVLMADGGSKPIGTIQPGDTVAATDPDTGDTHARTVTGVWHHHDTLIDLELNKGVVTTTEDHPFWNATDQQWQPAKQLTPGDQLLTTNGTTATIKGLNQTTEHNDTAYNITVADIHTYYVLAGDTPVLVHNTNGCPVVPWITGKLPAAEESALSNTLAHIDAGTVPTGPTANKWGTPFLNKDGDLPGGQFANSPYLEYRVAPPPGTKGAGPLRVVRDSKTGATYYTWTHYGDAGDPTFVQIR
jgi:hypothetical protein